MKSTDRSVAGWACERGSNNIGVTALAVRSSATIRGSVKFRITYVLLARQIPSFGLDLTLFKI